MLMLFVAWYWLCALCVGALIERRVVDVLLSLFVLNYDTEKNHVWHGKNSKKKENIHLHTTQHNYITLNFTN